MTILILHQAVPPTFYNKIAPMGALVKQSTWTLQLLLGAPLKAEYLFMMWFGKFYMSG